MSRGERRGRGEPGLPARAVEAVTLLGRGFLAAPGNGALRAGLAHGEIPAQRLLEELMCLVYRLLFLAAAEDRRLLPDPAATRLARQRYQRELSFDRLQRLAAGGGGATGGEPARCGASWEALRRLSALLAGTEDGRPWGVPVLGGALWSSEAASHLERCALDDETLCGAVAVLERGSCGAARGGRATDFSRIDAQELGAVHEALLELHVELEPGQRGLVLKKAVGHQRKTCGSYTTPPSLIDCLLDTTLAPVLEEAAAAGNGQQAEQAILGLRICDPACGTGTFLIAAAQRLAERLATVRCPGGPPAAGAVQAALAEVVERCIYGVDRQPLTVELCKLGLWLAAGQASRPISSLDRRIRCGNSLLGATPALLASGIPDAAFEPVGGDDPAFCRQLRRQNRQGWRASGQGSLFALAAAAAGPAPAESAVAEGSAASRRTLAEHGKLLADAWCVAFVAAKGGPGEEPAVACRSAGAGEEKGVNGGGEGEDHGASGAITEEVFRRLERDPAALPPRLASLVQRLAQQHRFLHWHLEFPEVFRDVGVGGGACGWTGGFDVVLANPPWERIKLQEKEWFAVRRPDIARAPHKASRQNLIDRLAEEDPALYRELAKQRRTAEAEAHLLRNSGRYPLCGRGDLNTYALFAECCLQIVHPRGAVGLIVPSGIASDETTRFFFQDLIERRALHQLYDFENRARLFPGVDGRMKFSLLTLAGAERPAGRGAEVVCFAHRPEDLRDTERRFTLAPEDLQRIHPNTRTCPMFRTRRDARLTLRLHERAPVLWLDGPPEQNPWGLRLGTMFHMAGDSGLFRTHAELAADGWRLEGNVFLREEQRFLPLYEAKMAQAFDHRAAGVVLSPEVVHRQGQPSALSAAAHADAAALPLPRYWVPEEEVLARLPAGVPDGLLGFTDVTGPTNERTMLATLLPIVGVGHTMPLAYARSAEELLILLCVWNSFVFDYAARQQIGGIHLTFFLLKQLPVPRPEVFAAPCLWSPGTTTGEWVARRGLELSYTAVDLAPFARRCGCTAPPFPWDPERRLLLRCELDAAMFLLYGVEPDDIAYILDTFPIVARKDRERYGGYRTKDLILDRYAELKAKSV